MNKFKFVNSRCFNLLKKYSYDNLNYLKEHYAIRSIQNSSKLLIALPRVLCAFYFRHKYDYFITHSFRYLAVEHEKKNCLSYKIQSLNSIHSTLRIFQSKII